MFKKIISIFLITIFITSCGGSFDSVKRGLTGAKKIQADEFLVQKKDPLILPPDFENLPTPDERIAATEEISSFEKSLGNTAEIEITEESSSVEESILKKIQSQ
tara:strand:+ start:588 stop:899 length:312 start_codon:yes stop_codon:yes gene_type:complete